MSQDYKFLIVDDSTFERAILHNAVVREAPDATVIEAANSEEALKKIKGDHIAAGIIDLDLPGMSGVDLALELRQRFATIPLALCSENISDVDWQKVVEHNIRFIQKPVNHEKVKDFLQASVDA